MFFFATFQNKYYETVYNGELLAKRFSHSDTPLLSTLKFTSDTEVESMIVHRLDDLKCRGIFFRKKRFVWQKEA